MMLTVALSILAVTIPPANDTRIVDQAELLTPSQTTELAALFSDVQTKQHVNLGLLTLRELDDAPKAVAVRTLNFWQMSPDSVLVLISLNPRKIFLQPGSNLQYLFTEAASVAVIRDHLIPGLKSGRYGAGILNGFHAISHTLPGPTVAPAPNTAALSPVVTTTGAVATTTEPEKNTDKTAMFLIIFVLSGGLIALGFTWWARRRRAMAPIENPYAGSTGFVSGGGGIAAPPVIVNNNGGGGNGFLEGLILGDMLSNHNTETVVEHHHDSPPPPVEEESRPSYSSSDDSSSSFGGGGSDWGSSGGGFDSSGGGGGGGSDW